MKFLCPGEPFTSLFSSDASAFILEENVCVLTYVCCGLFSEFDIAALVVYVGEVYTTAHQKKQWVFVTDGSVSELGSEEASNSLLAISFCASSVDDSFAPVNYNLKGSIVSLFYILDYRFSLTSD